jgi:hypothetical protein
MMFKYTLYNDHNERLFSMSISSYIYHFFVLRTFKSHSSCCLEIFSTILTTRVSLLCSITPEFISPAIL